MKKDIWKHKPCLNCGGYSPHMFCNGDCKRVWYRSFDLADDEEKATLRKKMEDWCKTWD